MEIDKKIILDIKKLSFLYDNRSILHELNFLMYADEKIFINGENGAGKTTLLKLILGLYKNSSLYFDTFQCNNVNIFSREWYKRRRSIAYMPQNKENIQAPFSVLEVIQTGIYHYKKNIHNEKIYELMNYFDLYKHKNKQFRYLSGGEKQKTMIIRALMQSPSLLLLDEPFVSLDHKSQHLLIDFLNKDMFEHKPLSCILVTHASEDIFDASWNKKKLTQGSLY